MRAQLKTLKPKKCRQCKETFVPARYMQAVCGPKCARDHAIAKREREEEKARREERAKHRAAKERIKTRSDHLRETQQAFNAYIRERDHALPCVSCGRYHQGQFHAGHYRTVGGNPELRFEELNCHKQCAPCNNHKSGDIVNYRITLIQRIGEEKVAWLEGPHEPKHYSIDDLQDMKRQYRAKTRDLAKRRERGL